VHTWYTDFRRDVARVNVPTLVMHGDSDRIAPVKASGARTAELIKGARFVEVKNGLHAINWTHADVVNGELLSFLG
jgi:pimeloyl-ACP methyl ester carboxylesterase